MGGVAVMAYGLVGFPVPRENHRTGVPQAVAQTLTPVCHDGGVLSDGECTLTTSRVESYPAVSHTTYSCQRGGTLSGATCTLTTQTEQTVGYYLETETQYYCDYGVLSGTTCYWYSPVGLHSAPAKSRTVVVGNCVPGYARYGTYCYRTETVTNTETYAATATTTYYCGLAVVPPSATCTRTVYDTETYPPRMDCVLNGETVDLTLCETAEPTPTTTVPTTTVPTTTVPTTTVPTTTTVVASDSCTTELGVLTPETITRHGVWSQSDSCLSSQRGDAQDPHYARRFEFTLDLDVSVKIGLFDLSKTVDSYLYLLSGHGTDGEIVGQNDDASSVLMNWSPNSELDTPLDAGDYTIEATTLRKDRTGSFTLTVTADITPPADTCTTHLGTLSVVSRPSYESSSTSWNSSTSCVSLNRDTHHAERFTFTYAEYFTFSLDSESIIDIKLTSQHDTYLFLIDGQTHTKGWRQQNDDIRSYPPHNRNSHLYGRLAAGKYTIEATTYDPQKVGSFTLSVGLMTGTGGFCPAPV